MYCVYIYIYYSTQYMAMYVLYICVHLKGASNLRLGQTLVISLTKKGPEESFNGKVSAAVSFGLRQQFKSLALKVTRVCKMSGQ